MCLLARSNAWSTVLLCVLLAVSARSAWAAEPAAPHGATKHAPPPGHPASAGHANSGRANSDSEPAEDSSDAPAPAGSSSVPANWKAGPATIELGHDLKLALPAAYLYLDPANSVKVLEKMGNFHNENLLGIVASNDDNADWFVTFRFEDEGYVKDEEKIDADELLKAMREGTEEDNKERTQKGFKPLHVDGWTDPPRYEKSAHHLVWALEVSDDEGKSVNYNTRVLGRRGYASVNLITGPEHLAQYKPQAATLLAATTFGSGARYEDFDEKKGDKVAEYGLAGLVLGGAGLAAAKIVKIGLLAKFWKVIIAVLIAGKKAIIAALVAAGAFMKKLFGKKEAQTAPPATPGT